METTEQTEQLEIKEPKKVGKAKAKIEAILEEELGSEIKPKTDVASLLPKKPTSSTVTMGVRETTNSVLVKCPCCSEVGWVPVTIIKYVDNGDKFAPVPSLVFETPGIMRCINCGYTLTKEALKTEGRKEFATKKK